jgi:N-acetylglucosaminylphosphatidylinositol deacetylase
MDESAWKTVVTEAFRLLFLSYFAFSFIIYAIAQCSTLVNSLRTGFKRKFAAVAADKRVLLITAHPDDECMFFAPCIMQIIQNNTEPCQLFLLCLTNGKMCFFICW